MNRIKANWVVLIVIGIIAVGGYFFPKIQTQFGFTGTRFPNGISAGGLVVGSTGSGTLTSNKLTIGASGTAMGNVIYGTCTLLGDFSISASSTAMVDCQSSSFASGDYVSLFGYATSSVAMNRQFTIQSTGSASSTAGYAPMRITNWTGAAITPASLNGWGSSTPFMLIRA